MRYKVKALKELQEGIDSRAVVESELPNEHALQRS